MRVLITSPSFVPTENVSGISTLTALIVKYCDADFVPFTAGRRNGQGLDVNWLTRQATLPVRFLKTLKAAKPDVVHINTALESRAIWRDAVLAICAGLRKIPVVVHIHGGEFMTREMRSPMLRAAVKKMCGSAAEVIVLSSAEKSLLVERFGLRSINVLPNAIELGEMPKHRDQKIIRTILYLGRLDKAKGLGEIIEAARTLNWQGFKFKFKCFGAGPYEQEFISGMHEAIGDDFYFGGIVSGEEKFDAFATSDIFLLPSHFEGMPMALLEAMAAGCVPVVSDVGSISTAVNDGRNGYLIEPHNVTTLVGKLKFLLTGETKWESFRRKAREAIEKQFNVKDYSVKLQAIYVSAIEKTNKN